MVSWLSRRRARPRVRLVAALEHDQVGELLGDVHGRGLDRAAHDVAAAAGAGHPDGRRRGARAELEVVVARRDQRIRDCASLAIATCPTITCSPFEYCARILPAVGQADADQLRRRRAVLRTRRRRRGLAELRDAARSGCRCTDSSSGSCPPRRPSARDIEGDRRAHGRDPSVAHRCRSVSVPLAPEISKGVPAVPPLTSSPGMVTL